MRDILNIIVEYLYDEDLDLEVRTAALYASYGFFCHQMNRPKFKVNLIYL